MEEKLQKMDERIGNASVSPILAEEEIKVNRALDDS